MTLLQTLGRRIQQHCCKPSAVEARHCYGFSAMIPFCGTFPKDSKSTALGLLGLSFELRWSAIHGYQILRFFFRQSVLSDVFGLNGRHHWQLRAVAKV